MKALKNIITVLLCAATLTIVWLNIRLYSESYNREEKKNDIILQLNFLNQEIRTNQLADRMQEIFPEGFIFTNALYGLSWCEIGFIDTTVAIKTKAIHEALYAYNQINTNKATLFFDSTLIPKYGIFYLGWNNYLLSKILMLDSNFDGCMHYKRLYKKNCELIAEALKYHKTPFLQSYHNQCWPADMCVAMASLRNYEKIYDHRYKSIVTKWITDIKTKTDPRTALIPHKVSSENGKCVEGTRGSSISLLLRFLSEIDKEFSEEQYTLYKKHFVTTTIGLPSITEYPVGLSGLGDIDSGPVILGVGFAGTIVSIGSFSVMGDYDMAEQQYKTINTFGLSSKDSETKKYIWGQLPISDAFIAWSRTAQLYDSSRLQPSFTFWAYKFHCVSVITLLIVWLLFHTKSIFKKVRSTIRFRH